MTVEPGRVLLHYRLGERIGAGGMGEVWRAIDTTLGREVAIKVLPSGFCTDAERLARFEREAKVLASLNHPNIAAVYGLHEAAGVRFLAMELVPGEDLSQRIARGRLPIAETVEIARQIGEALEAAHEQGVIHRDLKPANIRLTPDGKVKVLDFGLAKALDPAAASASNHADTLMSPTITSLGTLAGVILGTAAYMSPEQARGKSADKRVDTWAFGVILFEMLSGRRPFDGESVSDTLAAVLKSEPDWSAIPADAPAGLTRVVRRCLAKDPRSRLRSAGDALLELETTEPAPVAARGSRREWIAWGSVVVLAVFASWTLRSRQAAPGAADERLAHIEYPFEVGASAVGLAPPAISPDGRMVVFGNRTGAGMSQLSLRRVDSFEVKPLPETDDAVFPFWSPDSRSVAYFAGGSLRCIDVESEATRVIYEHAPWARGGSWHENGTILFAPDPNSPILRIAAAGGAATPVTALDPKLADASHRFPHWLPDGRHFLYTFWSNNPDVLKNDGGIYVGSVEGGASRKILADASGAAYAPPGFVLFYRRGRLLAAPFDPATLTLGEETVSIDAGVTFLLSSGTLAASASRRGDLAYAIGAGEPDTELLWLDRGGHEKLALNQSGQFASLEVSPDGERFATARSEGTAGQQIWIGDAGRATLVPLTHGSNDSFDPVWSPDGSRVAFSSRETGTEDLYVQSVGGTTPWEKIHDAHEHDTRVTDWSRDGRFIFFDAQPRDDPSRQEIWLYDLQSKSARSLLSDTYPQLGARLSPDGRWLVYVSQEGGAPQLFIRSFPALDRKWLVAGESAGDPHWRADGREILFVSHDRTGAHMMSVELTPGPSGPNPGPPRELFVVDPRIEQVAPSSDHTRFLVGRKLDQTGRNAVRVILDWSTSVGRKTS